MSDRYQDGEHVTINGRRGTPLTVVSDNGTELTSRRSCAGPRISGCPGTTSHPASRPRTPSSKASMDGSATKASTRRCSRHSPMPGSSSPPGSATTIMSSRIPASVAPRPPRLPCGRRCTLVRGMPRTRVPSPPQTGINRQDSTHNWESLVEQVKGNPPHDRHIRPSKLIMCLEESRYRYSRDKDETPLLKHLRLQEFHQPSTSEDTKSRYLARPE